MFFQKVKNLNPAVVRKSPHDPLQMMKAFGLFWHNAIISHRAFSLYVAFSLYADVLENISIQECGDFTAVFCFVLLRPAHLELCTMTYPHSARATMPHRARVSREAPCACRAQSLFLFLKHRSYWHAQWSKVGAPP